MMSLTTSAAIFIVVLTSRDSFTGSASVPETEGQVSGLQAV